MLEKHPIPQNIMQVEFKLFGSLTVRQFFSLGGGVLIAAIIYFIPFPIILKAPLILISAAIGFSLAFITVNGLPFSRWLANFLIAIFSSQKYVWRKSIITPKVLRTGSIKVKPEVDTRSKKELGTTPIMEVVERRNIELDESEKKDLARLDKYFEAEFDKVKFPSSQSGQQSQHYEQPARVDSEGQNLAGKVNPIGRGQTHIDIDNKNKVVYTNVRNREQRPVQLGQEQRQVESKIKEILEKQKNLSPYLKTAEVEKKEKELKSEMRQLYQQIQDLKDKNG